MNKSDDTQPFVRFVGTRVDEDSNFREGMFQLAFRVVKEADLGLAVRTELTSQLDWLTEHLEAPRRLSPFRNPSRRTAIAISWFKPTALEHLVRARAVAELLTRLGFPVEEVRTTKPGYVTHEDEFQIVAVPFRET